MVTRERLNAAKRRRRILWISIAAVLATGVVVVSSLLFLESRGGQAELIGQPVSATILSQVTGVSDSTLSAVGIGEGVTAATIISGAPLTNDGKPEVFYLGGEFCPYCAVERWSMVIALSRFGEFENMQYMLSSPTDIFPNTATFTFRNSQYSSPYISFVAVEQYGRGGTSDVKQPPTAEQEALVTAYDSQRSIPFVDIANSYAIVGAQVAPSVLSGKNWTQISSQLNDPNSAVAKAVDGAANYMITAICTIDGGKPSRVCGHPYSTIPVSLPEPSASSLADPSSAFFVRSSERRRLV